MSDKPMRKWTVVALFFGAAVITEITRIALAVAAPTLMKLYDISPQVMGYVLSGWNWGYTGFLLLVGPLVDRFGPWLVMGIGWTIASLTTVALPVASTPVSIFLMRALFGLGSSVRLPSQASSLARWFAPAERATAVGLCFSGSPIGLAVGATMAAFVLNFLGWKAVFYCIGGASMLVTLLWLGLYPDKKVGRHGPSTQGESREGNQVARVSLASLLRHRSVWGLIFAQMGYLYAYFFFMTWLPGYLTLERKMTLLRTGIVASLPFWMGMIGTIAGGWLGDHLIRRGFSTTASRKGLVGAGLILATIMVITAAFTSQTWLAVTLLTLCMGSMRITTASFHATPMDLAPPGAAGSLACIQNFAGTLSGLLAAIVTGHIVQATGSFVAALVVAGSMALLGAISYVFLIGRLETLHMAPSVTSIQQRPSQGL